MKKKRLLSLLLGGMMLMGGGASLAGCGSDDYDFTVWVPMVSSVVGQYKDHQVFQKLEELTGKKVKYVHGEYDELVNMFSTGAYFDVMILNDAMPAFGGTYPGGIEKGIKDGKIIDISDKMSTLAPNYTAIVNGEDAIKKEVITDNGKMTAFYEITDKQQGVWYGYMMREDWLAKVPGFGNGTSVTKLPETYDDWEVIIEKFTEFNGNKAPFFLYSKGVDPFNSISAGYDVTFDFQLDETGKVNYGPYMDEFEEYLKRMQKWYNKGWIDKNFMLSTEYVAIADAVGGMTGKGFTEAKYGIFTQMYIYMTQYENTAHAFGNENYSLVAVPNPKLTKDQDLHVRQISARAGNYAVITDKCKDVDGVIGWLDNLYGEYRTMMNYGIEDVSYTMIDGKPHYTDLVTNNPQGLAPSDMVKKYSVQGFPSYLDIDRELQAAKPKEIKAINETWTQGNDGAYILPLISLTAEEGDRYSTIMTSLQKYTEEFIYKYISSASDAVTFDAFRKTLKDYGIEDAIAIKQAAYTRWQNRLG